MPWCLVWQLPPCHGLLTTIAKRCLPNQAKARAPSHTRCGQAARVCFEDCLFDPGSPQVYHSAYNDSPVEMCGCAVLPLRTKARGPAAPKKGVPLTRPRACIWVASGRRREQSVNRRCDQRSGGSALSLPDDGPDLADEVLTYFKPNMLYRTFDGGGVEPQNHGFSNFGFFFFVQLNNSDSYRRGSAGRLKRVLAGPRCGGGGGAGWRAAGLSEYPQKCLNRSLNPAGSGFKVRTSPAHICRQAR